MSQTRKEQYNEVRSEVTEEMRKMHRSFFGLEGAFDRDETILELLDKVSIKPHGVELNSFDEVIENIQNDRQSDYGDAGESFDNIADFWNVYLSRKIGVNVFDLDRIDVANMLELMKMSRFAYNRKYDSALDKASYADFALKFMNEEK